MTSSTTISLRPFTTDDTFFFAALASDERATRFVGDGLPWGSDMIAARVRIALDETPEATVGAVRWFLAVDEREPVGLLVSTRRNPVSRSAIGCLPSTGDAESPGPSLSRH